MVGSVGLHAPPAAARGTSVVAPSFPGGFLKFAIPAAVLAVGAAGCSHPLWCASGQSWQ
jgi:hypothetical protein